MPIGEQEIHPYLALGATPNATLLVLGSFPVYSRTDPDNEDKQHMRGAATIRFFYGSAASSFWRRYGRHVHPALPPNSTPATLQASLVQYGIAMSDCIKSCERIDYSPLDTHLRKKTYNQDGTHAKEGKYLFYLNLLPLISNQEYLNHA